MKTQIKFKAIASLVFTVILQVIFSGCAGVPDWLEEEMRSEPVAIFECDLQKAGCDALILLGIKDSSLIAGVNQWKTIGFFLKNKNIDSSAVNLSAEGTSNFIHFVRVNNKYLDDFVKDFPQLIGMEIFAAYLKELTVNKKSFLQFKTLGDGDLRNMSPRQVEYIKKRKICLIVINLTMENTSRYQKKVGNIF